MKLDIATVQSLLNEARKNYRRSQRKFEKYDNSEDMHEADAWYQTVSWLESRLDKLGGVEAL